MDRVMNIYHINYRGLRFQVTIIEDNDGRVPWAMFDGHGPVRHQWQQGRYVQKKPGERVLHRECDVVYLYDWQAACKKARKDGWNAEPHDAPNRIERAVQADFDYLRDFLRGEWCYIGVCVAMTNDDGEQLTEPYEHATWGIESNSDEYIIEVARELAGDLIAAEPVLTATLLLEQS